MQTIDLCTRAMFVVACCTMLCAGACSESPAPTDQASKPPRQIRKVKTDNHPPTRTAARPDAPSDAPNGKAGESRPGVRALLVGCADYENPDVADLLGAANDVRLMHRLLVERFAFPPEQIVVLANAGEIQRHPRRANIEREFKRLADAAQSGERVVIYLSGHGSWQPDDDPNNPDDLEPDGRDEVFCPIDVKRLSHQDKGIENGITDDELRAWLAAITQRGALVWLIVDSCHSGTIARAGSEETPRSILPEALLPEAERDKEERQGVVARGVDNEGVVLEAARRRGPGRLTMSYAAQPFETSPELPLPAGSPEAKRHGLFTFTLCQTLMNAEGITYRELVRRIHSRYQHQGRYGPTPLTEGDDVDNEVLDSKSHPGRSKIALRKSGDGWKINAGALHEITTNTVLAVLPKAGQEEDGGRPLGHVRATKVGPLDSVVEPCAFADVSEAIDFPDENRCEVVHVDYGLRRLKLAADSEKDDGRALSERELRELCGKLAPLRERVGSLVEVVDDPLTADWLLRARGTDLILVPTGNMPGQRDEPDPRRFGPILNEEPGDVVDWLEIRLPRIARASNLIRLASSQQEKWSRGRRIVNVEVELLTYPDDRDTDGQPVLWGRNGLVLLDGERIGCRITNRSRVPVDVCLLFIDSAFGIYQFFPEPGTAGNRLKPLDSFETLPGTVNAETVGMEHLAVIAVKALPQTEPLELAFLQQNRMEQTRKGGEDTLPSNWEEWRFPLAPLLVHCKDAQRGTRGLRRTALEEHSLKLISWRTKAKP